MSDYYFNIQFKTFEIELKDSSAFFKAWVINIRKYMQGIQLECRMCWI